MDYFPVDDTLRVGKVGKKDTDGNWSWETKIAVATHMQVLGNKRKACELVGVPLETVNTWVDKEWWENLNEEIRIQRRTEFSGKLGQIVEKALGKVEDRLENGDFVLNNKTGEILRKPVTLKDAARVATDLMTKQIKLEELNQTSKIATISVQEQLKNLALEFAKFNKNIKKNNATDIPFVESN
jgi:hypothetical protein